MRLPNIKYLPSQDDGIDCSGSQLVGIPFSPNMNRFCKGEGIDFCDFRVDRIELDAITVDLVKSRVLDDSITVKRLQNGGYRVYYNIVDLSRIINPASPIFRELMFRFQSLYYNNQDGSARIQYLFPAYFSSKVGFVLDSKVPKQAISFVFDFDSSGSLIESKPVDVVFSKVNVQAAYHNGSMASMADSQLPESARLLKQLLGLCDKSTRKESLDGTNHFISLLKAGLNKYLCDDNGANYLRKSITQGDPNVPFFNSNGKLVNIAQAKDLSTEELAVADVTKLYSDRGESSLDAYAEINAPIRKISALINLLLLSADMRSAPPVFSKQELKEIAAYLNMRVVQLGVIAEYPDKAKEVNLVPSNFSVLRTDNVGSTTDRVYEFEIEDVSLSIVGKNLDEVVALFAQLEAVYNFVQGVFAKRNDINQLKRHFAAIGFYNWDLVSAYIKYDIDLDKIKNPNGNNLPYLKELSEKLYYSLSIIANEVARIFKGKKAEGIIDRYERLKK